jgi:Tol biopolymer transport system component
MKKITFYLALILGVIVSLVAVSGTSVQAQEDLDTILARAAARGFLITLTNPPSPDSMNYPFRPELYFFVTDAVAVDLDEFVGDLGTVPTSYRLLRTGWLTPGETYQVEASLQPGNRTVIIDTSQVANRWQVVSFGFVDTPVTASFEATTGTAGVVVGNGSGKLAFQTRNGGDIYIVNADGTGLRHLTRGLDPQLSPDGTALAFTRWENGFELFTINVDGTDETAWFSNKAQMKSPTWSADGSRLVFSHRVFLDDGGFKSFFPGTFVKRSIREGERVNFPRIPSNARGLKINDDGSIEYTIPPDAHWHLAQVDLNTQEFRDLATGSSYNYAPNWHPTDPNTIFARGDKGVFLYNTLTQTGRPVSFDGGDRGPVVLSPDGAKLALSYWQNGHWEIHAMNIDGSNRQRLTETPLKVLAENSRSQVIVTEHGYRTLTRAQPDGHKNPHWNNAAPVWSPDGSQIAFVTDRSGKWEIWIMNADGSAQRPMFPNGVLDELNFEFAGVDERMLSWR